MRDSEEPPGSLINEYGLTNFVTGRGSKVIESSIAAADAIAARTTFQPFSPHTRQFHRPEVCVHRPAAVRTAIVSRTALLVSGRPETRHIFALIEGIACFEGGLESR